MTAAIAPAVLHAVFSEHQRLAFALSSALEGRGTTRPRDRFWMARALGALMRWWGWIEPLHMKRVEEQLLLAWLLDSVEVGPMAKVWAARIGRHPDRLVPVGDAPNWTGRAEGLKRWTEGRAVNADPWRLFPAWLRDQLPVPPGDATPKVQKARFPGRACRRGRRSGSRCAARTKRRSGPSSGTPSSNRGSIAGSRPPPGCRRTPT